MLLFITALTHTQLVGPQCSSLCVLQEAVVQAAVQEAGVGDLQASIMKHEDGVHVTVETRVQSQLCLWMTFDPAGWCDAHRAAAISGAQKGSESEPP
ncbi:hypothetical protein F7725_020167, partial [Dissostichus mawsoni]